MKLSIMIVSAAVIILGLLYRYTPSVIVGAVIHFAFGVADLFQLYRHAKLLRGSTSEPEAPPTIPARVAKWIEVAITLTGLVLVVATQRGGTSGYAIAGWIIWGGAIVCYVASGIIARDVGGVPLSMGYGGWRVRRDRNGNFRK